jgi:hypothetical protein
MIQMWYESLHAAEQDRPDVAAKRAFWRRHQHKIDPRRLIFVDEIWAELPKVPAAQRVERQRRERRT